MSNVFHVRRFAVLVAVITAMLAALVVPASASATSMSCTNGSPASCLYVHGASTWVDFVQGGVALAGFGGNSIRGHNQIYDSHHTFNFNSRTYTFYNPGPAFKTFWTNRHYMNRRLPNGDVVCSIFWEWKNGHYVKHGPACATVRA